MREELERYKRALAGARHALGMVERNPQVLADISYLTAVQREIDDILAPPPEFEEVEECAGWAAINFSQSTGMPYVAAVYLPEDRDKILNHPDRLTVQEIRVKVKRPVKRPVVREVEVEAEIGGSGAKKSHICKGDAAGLENDCPFHSHPECHGKTGTLIPLGGERMNDELSRHKEALKVAIGALRELGLDYAHFTETVEKRVAAVLEPPEEFEMVGVGAYFVIPIDGDVYTQVSEERAMQMRDEGYTVAFLSATIKRPVRRAVIREYEVAAKVDNYGLPRTLGGAPYPFADHPECHGKAGVLIFRTAE